MDIQKKIIYSELIEYYILKLSEPELVDYIRYLSDKQSGDQKNVSTNN